MYVLGIEERFYVQQVKLQTNENEFIRIFTPAAPLGGMRNKGG
jgi:hypothetical protein